MPLTTSDFYNPYSARNARVEVNRGAGAAIGLFVAKAWDVEVKTEALDFTNFKSKAKRESLAGNSMLTFTIETNDNGLDVATNVFRPGFYASAINVKLYLNAFVRGIGPYWSIPTPFIDSVAFRADVNGAMGVVIRGHGSGEFSFPSGQAAADADAADWGFF